MKPQNNLHILKQVQLSEEERGQLWLRISAQKDQVFKDLTDTDLNYSSPIFNWRALVSSITYVTVPVAAFGLLLVSASSSLPGQQLYGFKTGVNEELQRLTTFGELDKFELERSLLTKRVMEAKELKSLGLLDEEAATSIEDSITKQADKVIKSKRSNNDSESGDKDGESDDEQDLDDAVAVAEMTGAAAGSIEAVRVLAGTSGENVKVEPQDKPQADESSSFLQPHNPTVEAKPASELPKKVKISDNTGSGEALIKATIQAKAIMVTAEAEAASQEGKSTMTKKLDPASLVSKNSSDDELEDQGQNYVSDKIKTAKETVERDIDSLETGDLLQAVEEASAARAVGEALGEK